ncbi:gp436 family protein [Escherichia coli]|uniref:gp436 family protein n=1 Tax=Escherichia coli TaxID=562 RepID=UPI00202CC68F|nr:DUF1320 domain-containing protein [Escherichia coli]
MAINRETNELDEGKIRQAISDAEAEIDSFLSRRYQLPLGVTEIPRPLQRVAVSLAFYWLSERDNQITELIQKRYDDAIKTLREMANGTVTWVCRRMPPRQKPTTGRSLWWVPMPGCSPVTT